jgi:acetyl-CoA carboxylase biotin carboxyl carrier protein
VALESVTDAVRLLTDIMRSNGLTEIDIAAGDISIRLRAAKTGGGTKSSVTANVTAAGDVAVAPPISGHVVTAPMIGTFYASPAPGEPPFIRVGDTVQAGQTIGIIEAMKIMNEIVSDRAGVVLEVIAANAQAVEYGSPLVRLDIDSDAGE